MDIRKAREIISTLAEGIDPLTGEVLPSEHICNQGEVVRAFYALLKETDTAKEKKQPENAGKPWTTDLDNELKERFESGESVPALGMYFGRTQNSIESRLVKLGLKEME